MQMKNDRCVSVPLLVELELNSQKTYIRNPVFTPDKLHKYLRLCSLHAATLFTQMSLNFNKWKKAAFYLKKEKTKADTLGHSDNNAHLLASGLANCSEKLMSKYKAPLQCFIACLLTLCSVFKGNVGFLRL